MERYEAYKDSGVEWIGEIPVNWKIMPIRVLATYNDETLSEGTDPEYRFNYIDISSVSEGSIDSYSEQVFSSAPSRARRVVRKRDVLVSTVRTYLKAIALVDEKHTGFIASTGFCVLRPKANTNSRWFGYALSEESIIDEMVARSVGVSYPAINASDLVKLQLRYPPIEEQRAIADYLDVETAEIDALVADCEREVELLQEYRKAVISEAVTKGLDPDAPMKNSGIEWIGEIPEGWRIVRVKFLANRLNVGVVINPSTYYDDNGTIPFLKGSNIQGESIDLSDVSMITEVSNELLQKTQIHTGDIVMVRVGDPGRSVVVPPVLDGANVASMLEVTCGDAVIPEYLCRVFNSHLSALQVGLYTYGAAMKQINVSDLAEFYIPLPESIREQERMMSELNRKTSQIDSLIDAKKSMADKLREYRKSLISEVVTGKFKVPGA